MRKKKETHQTSETKRSGKLHHSIIHRHQQKMDEFQNRDEQVKSIEQKIILLQKELEKSNSPIVRSEITDLQTKKKNIESGQAEIDYLLESSQILMNLMSLDDKERKLLDAQDNADTAAQLNAIAHEKQILIDEYLTKFDESYVSSRNTLIKENIVCSQCDEHLEYKDGFLICPTCGLCKNMIETAGELSYKEMQDYDYRPQFTYDKMTHLEDWLKRFQAKENRLVPQEVLDKVIIEARKERIRDLNILTEEKVKKYLKKNNLNEYYDNVIGIINRINSRPPFNLTSEIEQKIKFMFQQIQEPYEKHKPPNRKNFLSYSYTLHKFFQILGLHEFAKYFPLLKSADKLRQQDDIFKKVVAEMAKKDKTIKWVFFPSI